MQIGLRELCRQSVQFLFPPACARCGRELPGDGGGRLCSECRSRIAPPTPHVCRRCGAPVGPYLDSENGCIHCRTDRFRFTAVQALGIYEHDLRAAVLAAKARGGEVLAAGLTEELWHRRARALSDIAADVVVPVPQHWRRRFLLTHNAAEMIAEVLARRLRVPGHRNILAKVRSSPPQARLKPKERRRNLRNAFRARTRLDGLKVLLADDVLTTGTTADECSRALLDAGAASVAVAVLARGIGR